MPPAPKVRVSYWNRCETLLLDFTLTKSWEFPAAGSCTTWDSRPVDITSVHSANQVGTAINTQLDGPRNIDLSRAKLSPTSLPEIGVQGNFTQHFCQTGTGGFYQRMGSCTLSFKAPDFVANFIGMPIVVDIGWTGSFNSSQNPSTHTIGFTLDVSELLVGAVSQFSYNTYTRGGLGFFIYQRVVGVLKTAQLGHFFARISWQEDYYPNEVDPLKSEHHVVVNMAADHMVLTPIAALTETVASDGSDSSQPYHCEAGCSISQPGEDC